MKQIILATAIVTMMSGAAFAQAGQSECPTAQLVPCWREPAGNTSTGTAVDRPDSMKGGKTTSGTTGMNKGADGDGMAKGAMKK